MLSMVVLIFDLATDVKVIATNLSITGFMLSHRRGVLTGSKPRRMMSMSTGAGPRGFVIFVLLLWPLWTSKFFTSDALLLNVTLRARRDRCLQYSQVIYLVLTIGTIAYYRNRIEPTISLGVIVLVCGQTLAILNPSLRKIDFASIVAVVATAVLGYWLGRMQLFNPLHDAEDAVGCAS